MRFRDLSLAGWVVPALLLGAVLLRPAELDPVADPAPSALRDFTADETRTIPAYIDADDPRRTVRVFSVRFYAHAGERRFVATQVVARQPSSTPDPLLMAAVSITCSPALGGVVNAGATQNLMRGSAATFTPRFVYVVPRTGMVACVVTATGLRPRPSASGYRSANVWQVDSGSYLSVSDPIGSWPRSIETTARSRVLDHGEHWTPIRRRVSVGRVSSFRVVSDHKLTTCSAVGGSRDTTTAGRELCDNRVSTIGSTLRLVVRAVQLTSRGRPCAEAQVVAQRLARVRAAVHHQMVFAGGEVSVSRAPGCVPDFNLFGTLTQVWGADVVVHATSELTSVLPR
jgi:hypothetical protein